MKFWVPLILNSKHEIQSLFSLTTSEGHVVFLFNNTKKLADFMEAGSVLMAAIGGKIGHYEMEAASFNAAVSQLLKTDPSLIGQAIFISDADPLFEVYFKQMQSMAGSSK